MASKHTHLKKFYRINQYINAVTVRLLDENGKQIGVMPIEEARAKSRQTDQDLVEISDNATPPVVKLIDFTKFKYQEAKKQKGQKLGKKGGETKELQMTPFIGPGDYETRLKKAIKFLASGNKIKLSIKFLGRQITKKEFGYNLANRFTQDLVDHAAVEGEAKLMGKLLILTLAPKKGKKDNEKKISQAQN